MQSTVTARLDSEPLPPPRRRRASGAATTSGDQLFRWMTAGAAWLVLITLLGAALSMAWGVHLAFQTFGWSFITSANWDAVGLQFGALVPIYGTLVSSAIAMLIAVP